MGLEFRESGLNLNAKNDRMVKAKMVLNVSLGFQNLHNQTKNPKIQNFSLLLADTVIAGDQNPDVVTSKSSKAVKDVITHLCEKPRARAEMNGGENLMSKTTLRSDNGEISKEELRRQHQAELARQKNEETARRLAGVGSANGDSRAASKTSADLVAYKNVNDIPPARDLMIQIDQKNEAVLLPIYGSMVPFHVSTIRTVSSQQDTNRTCYIRIIFNVPGTAFNPHDSNSLKHQGAILAYK
uniref:FACT complex subunit n=1 Tax=Salix viminalis TaxID=40686 RepID=A0A6N2LI76_SALVM